MILEQGRTKEGTVSLTTENSLSEVHYITDVDGNTVGVVVPIDLWREIESERETAYLLKSETMKQRLLEAKGRGTGLELERAHTPRGRK